MDAQKLKAKRAERRKFRVRKSIYGTPERPRLSVFRSNLHIYAQLIDDLNGVTLAAAGSTAKAAGLKHGANVSAATEVGRQIAAKAKEKGITKAAFDRGPYRFHGRVAALAQAATAAGLACTGEPPVHKHKDAAPPADAKAKGGKGDAKPKGDAKKGGGDKKGDKK